MADHSVSPEQVLMLDESEMRHLENEGTVRHFSKGEAIWKNGDDPDAVLANRRLAFESAGLDPAQAVFLQQVHGDRILEARLGDAGRGLAAWDDGLPGCDAVFTRQQGLALTIGHADCLAVVLADPGSGILGVAHLGWRGALAGLAGALARKMVEAGAQKQGLRALLGPCLAPGHLELAEEQYRAFGQAFKNGLGNIAGELKQGKFQLDLRACATLQLLDLGLHPGQLLSQPLCSYSYPDLFYSYRRDAGSTGRMLTVAYLK